MSGYSSATVATADELHWEAYSHRVLVDGRCATCGGFGPCLPLVVALHGLGDRLPRRHPGAALPEHTAAGQFRWLP